MKASLVLLLPLLAPSAARAQDFWLNKPYKEWTAKECRKVLEDSPWARQHIISRVLVESLSEPSSDRARENNPRIVYTIQFRTARPLRQAMIGEQQTAARSSAPTPEQKAAFDKSAEAFLAQPFPDTVIVFIEFSSNVQSYQSDLERIWGTRTEPWAQNEIFLINGKGQKVPPLRFSRRASGGAFQVVFPRNFAGQPFLSVADKEVQIEFPHPTIGILTGSRVLEVFRIPKMIVDGKLEH